MSLDNLTHRSSEAHRGGTTSSPQSATRSRRPPPPILEFCAVSKAYRQPGFLKTKVFTALDDFSLAVPPGEVFGLLGPNGAGKTTAIKLMLGLLFPTRGEVRLFGQPIPDTRLLQRVGYVPEGGGLYPYLTCRETIEFFTRLSGAFADPDRVLDQVGLGGEQGRLVRDCSRGMRQRVALAQALAHRPDLLVLDEPTSGLDPLALQDMRRLILALREAGKTIFFSSHQISEVEKVCDRVGILVQGKLARLIARKEWEGKPAALEQAFAETVGSRGEVRPIRWEPA